MPGNGEQRCAFAHPTWLHRGKSTEESFDKAWRGNEFALGEAKNEYYQLNFGQLDQNAPLKDKRFPALAQKFFDPLLNNLVSI